MSVVFVRPTEQPPSGAAFQFNPLLPRPVFCALGSVPRVDLVSGKAGTTVAAEGYVPTRHGIALRTARQVNGGLRFGTNNPRVKTDTWTIIVLANPSANSQIQTFFSQRTAASPFLQFQFAANSDSALAVRNGGFGFHLYNGTASFGSQTVSTSVIDGGYHVFAATRQSSGLSPRLYFDGRELAVTATGSPATTISSPQETRIGNVADYGADAIYAAACDLPIVVVYPAVLSDAQIFELGNRPNAVYRAFRRQSRRVWIPSAAAAGSDATLSSTLAGASVAASGQLPITASATAQTAGATASASGALSIAAVASPALAGATLSSAGQSSILAALASELSGATLAAAGASAITAGLSAELAPATLSAAGQSAITAAASVSLAGPTLAATAALPLQASLVASLAPASLSAQGELGAVTTGELAVTLTGAGLTATGALPIGAAAVIGLGGASVSASAALGLRASLAATLAGATVASDGAHGMVVTGALSSALAGASVASAAVLSIAGATAVSLAGASAAATARTLLVGSASVALAGCTIVAAGTVSSPIAGALSSTLAGASVSAAGVLFAPSVGDSAAWSYSVAPDSLRFSVLPDDLAYQVRTHQ